MGRANAGQIAAYRSALRRTVSLVLIPAAFVAGYMVYPRTPQPQQRAVTPLFYQDPMHPAYRSDKPGIAPDCGMKLEPVYAEAAANSSTRGAVTVSLDEEQLIGIKTATVTRGPGAHTVRLVGKVTADESRVSRVSALADGVVRQVSPVAAGNLVKKDDLLATYFVPVREVFTAMQSYLIALGRNDQLLSSKADSSLVDGSKAEARLEEELLRSYGLTTRQIQDLARTRQITRDIEFRSPITGIVLSRTVDPGQRVDRGTELFRIADLQHIWVLADVFEVDEGALTPGSRARVRYQGHTWPATVTTARQFDPASRTLKVRLEVSNPGLVLRPEMFTEVEFDAWEPDGITVPADALIDAGTRRIVFISRGNGRFEPREVSLGAHYGDHVQIVRGLSDGETIVTSGLFLLDSESRLHLAPGRDVSSPAAHVSASSGFDPQLSVPKPAALQN